MPVTKEEIMKVIQENTQGPRYWPDILTAMDEWAAIQTAERDARIAGLLGRIKLLEEVEQLTKEQRDEWATLSIRKQTRIEELEKSLRELVLLKKLKDAAGKTDDYLLRQPIAWETATQLINTRKG